MNQWDVSFERPPWEAVLAALHPEDTLSAVQFLSMMETESDDAVEEVLQALEEKGVLLDISKLPEDFGTGDTAVRLRWEQQLVQKKALLTSLEENDPLRLYLQELSEIPTCDDPQILAKAYLSGDQGVLPRLTNAMLGSVVELAFSHVGRGVLLLDLIQEGSLGLWQAITDYDGGDFTAHCHRRISMAMAETVVLQARAAGIGKKMRSLMEDYQSVDEQLLSELGRNPTEEEIANQLHLSIQETGFVKEMLDAARMLARTAPAEEPEESQENMAVEDTAYFQMRQRIEELLSILPEPDAKLLSLRFGLDGKLPMSLEQVGNVLGLTPEEVVAKEAAALAKLRTNRETTGE